jgi:hypothetical protein
MNRFLSTITTALALAGSITAAHAGPCFDLWGPRMLAANPAQSTAAVYGLNACIANNIANAYTTEEINSAYAEQARAQNINRRGAEWLASHR